MQKMNVIAKISYL